MSWVALTLFLGIVVPILVLVLKGRSEYSIQMRRKTSLSSISLPAAKALLMRLLSEGALFVVSPRAQSSKQTSYLLPLAVRDLFEDYETIEFSDGSIVLSRELAEKGVERRGLVVFGRGLVGTESEFDLCASKSSMDVYEVSVNEIQDSIGDSFPSVYHWLISETEEHEI